MHGEAGLSPNRQVAWPNLRSGATISCTKNRRGCRQDYQLGPCLTRVPFINLPHFQTPATSNHCIRAVRKQRTDRSRDTGVNFEYSMKGWNDGRASSSMLLCAVISVWTDSE